MKYLIVSILFFVVLNTLFSVLIGNYILEDGDETRIVIQKEVSKISVIDTSTLEMKLDSIQIQLDNVLSRQSETGDILYVFSQEQEELKLAISNLNKLSAQTLIKADDSQSSKMRCYAGRVQLVSPFTAPYMTGKDEPEEFNIVWEGWVDLCFDGKIMWGESYGPTGDYGGKVRPDVEPSLGQ